MTAVGDSIFDIIVETYLGFFQWSWNTIHNLHSQIEFTLINLPFYSVNSICIVFKKPPTPNDINNFESR